MSSSKYSKSGSKSAANRKITRRLDAATKSKTTNISKAIMTVNKKVDKLKSDVKNKSEYRYYDTLNIGTISNTGAIFLLNGMNQGSNNAQREGTDMLIKHIRVVLNYVVSDTTNLIRIMLIYDKQTNSTTPALSDVLDTTIIPPVLAYRVDSNKERFTVLYDKLHSGVLNTDNMQRVVKIHKRMNAKTLYNTLNSTGFVGIQKGALFLLIVSDSNATAHPGVNVASRLRYVA